MRIAILLPQLRGGGVERIRLVLAGEFVRAGHEVEFVLMQARGQLLPEAESCFPVRTLGCTRFRHAPLAVARYLSERKPDAVLAAMWPLTGIAGFAVRLSRVRTSLVASEHNDFRMAPALKPYERLALRYFGRRFYGPCQRVVAVSEGVAASLREVAGLREDRMSVIHNPVRTCERSELSDVDRCRVAGWLDGRLRLVSVGTLKPQKGYDVLLRAFAELRQQRDAKLLILGDGPLRQELEGLARELGVAEHVWFPGFRGNPGAFLEHADVFALASRWEGFGNVIVEALSAGVPVVSTDCRSGPSEILENGRYGRLVPVDDPTALARGIEEVVVDPPKPEVLKERAAGFSAEKAANAYLDVMFPERRVAACVREWPERL